MTDHKTMNTVVHAAFRRDLGRFDAALAAYRDGARPRADQLKRAWDWFESELHHHHDYEETFFWPALGETDADLSAVAELDGEHDAMRAALTEASAAMDRFHAQASADEAAAARSSVAQLREVLLGHLAHEERDLEPISAQYASSAPMKAALKAVTKAHQGRLGNVLAWLQDGADADARRGLRQQIPAPVVFIASAVGGRRYRRDIASVWT